jgi:hypothetical protein
MASGSDPWPFDTNFHQQKTRLPGAVITVPPTFDELAFWTELKTRRSDASWVSPRTRAQDGDLLDWAPSNLLPRLCSEKLQRVIDGFSSTLVWLPVGVETSQGQVRYFILHFPEFRDVVDPDQSIFLGGRLYKPHLAARKVGPQSIFAIHPLSPAAIVNDEVRQAITEARCTGIEFEHVPCS